MGIVKDFLAQHGKDSDPLDLAETARQMYEPYLDAEDLAKVAAMDAGDAAYFWIELYYQIEHDLSRAILYGMEDMARARLVGLAQDDDVSGTPFSDAERSVSPHGWFARSPIGGVRCR